MSLWHLIVKEIMHRKGRFALGVLSVVAAVGCLTGSVTLLKAHDIGTQHILAAKQAETEQKMAELKEDMRKATLKLGFNLAITFTAFSKMTVFDPDQCVLNVSYNLQDILHFSVA